MFSTSSPLLYIAVATVRFTPSLPLDNIIIYYTRRYIQPLYNNDIFTLHLRTPVPTTVILCKYYFYFFIILYKTFFFLHARHVSCRHVYIYVFRILYIRILLLRHNIIIKYTYGRVWYKPDKKFTNSIYFQFENI